MYTSLYPILYSENGRSRGIHLFVKNVKHIKKFRMKCFIFMAEINLYIFHGHVFAKRIKFSQESVARLACALPIKV